VATITVGRKIPSFFLYGEAPREHAERTVHVETIAFRSVRHHWKIHPHLHRSLHQLIFVARGSGVALAESESADYRGPALIVVPAGTVHGFEFEPGTQGFVVSLSDDLRREMERREPTVSALFEAPATLELADDALRATDLEQSFAMFAREFPRSTPGHALALDGLLEVILANVMRLSHSFLEGGDAAVGPRRRLVGCFRELIESEFRNNRSLADYASALNVSESRLRKACLSVGEQSPMQMVHARVLLEAKRELLHTSLSVSEIAYSLGFGDPAYFARFFSRRTGMSPTTFRLRGIPPA
jgi:AraC family transcriptional activator of pobA